MRRPKHTRLGLGRARWHRVAPTSAVPAAQVPGNRTRTTRLPGLCHHLPTLPPPHTRSDSSWSFLTVLVNRTSTDEKGDPDLFGASSGGPRRCHKRNWAGDWRQRSLRRPASSSAQRPGFLTSSLLLGRPSSP